MFLLVTNLVSMHQNITNASKHKFQDVEKPVGADPWPERARDGE